MRIGRPFLVRNVVIPTPPAPDQPAGEDVAISSAVGTHDGGVLFDLPSPPLAVFPARVRYHYAPAGVLPDDVSTLEEIEAHSVAAGDVETTGAGQYRVEPPAELAPGDYDVALVCLFAV